MPTRADPKNYHPKRGAKVREQIAVQGILVLLRPRDVIKSKKLNFGISAKSQHLYSTVRVLDFSPVLVPCRCNQLIEAIKNSIWPWVDIEDFRLLSLWILDCLLVTYHDLILKLQFWFLVDEISWLEQLRIEFGTMSIIEDFNPRIPLKFLGEEENTRIIFHETAWALREII